MTRKTTTSWQVKKRYNDRVYARVACDLPKEVVEKFKGKCNALGVSQASVILEAIEKFLEDDE